MLGPGSTQRSMLIMADYSSLRWLDPEANRPATFAQVAGRGHRRVSTQGRSLPKRRMGEWRLSRRSTSSIPAFTCRCCRVIAILRPNRTTATMHSNIDTQAYTYTYTQEYHLRQHRISPTCTHQRTHRHLPFSLTPLGLSFVVQ